MSDYILEMKGITKDFYGVKALENVDLNVKRGEIHCLVGENGAGKSTMMKVLSGIYKYGDYSGEIYYNGELCKFGRLKDSEEKGIVIIHQELALAPNLTVAENLFMGNERTSGPGKFVVDWNKTYAEASKYLKMLNFKYDPSMRIKDLGVGAQQLVEIAKALAKNVKLLILDEPTAALPETDSRDLLNLLLELKNQGVTSIIISHKLHEICYVGDRVTVIRDGKSVCCLADESKPFSQDVIIKHMVGRELENVYPKREKNTVTDEIGFEIKNWNTYHPVYREIQVVKNANLYVKKGEIVGLYGLMGAGRTEMAMSVFGRTYGVDTSGEVYKDGKKVDFTRVSKAVENNVVYISEDRKTYGLVLPKDVLFNTSLAGIKKISKNGIIDSNKDVLVAQEYIDKLKIRCSGIDQKIESLSGGNQQKVSISKWLFTQPDVLILDEPTRGIDVGAKYEIYCIMNDLVEQGKTVLFISSDMSEILGMADRIYVMNEGEICGQLDRKTASQETIMQCVFDHLKKGRD